VCCYSPRAAESGAAPTPSGTVLCEAAVPVIIHNAVNIYIYRERERERERLFSAVAEEIRISI
jgi:hypothetical protein